jgi:hypothetical protein
MHFVARLRVFFWFSQWSCQSPPPPPPPLLLLLLLLLLSVICYLLSVS